MTLNSLTSATPPAEDPTSPHPEQFGRKQRCRLRRKAAAKAFARMDGYVRRLASSFTVRLAILQREAFSRAHVPEPVMQTQHGPRLREKANSLDTALAIFPIKGT